MNKALGGGIEASTKSVIERYLNRRQFFSLKDTIMAKMDAMMKPGFKGISDKQKNILKGLSDKERLEVGKQNFLSSKEQKAFDNLEQQSSTASIFSQALYMGMINTVVPFIATFIGLGATMGLQTLMPAANSQ
jgi:biopolymer transport protein ExbB/TolQ